VRSDSKSGFTLVEIMIVVVIIGLLISMAIPAFEKIRMNSQNARLANDLRVLSGSMEIFALELGEYPEDSNSGAIPEGFEEYVNSETWNKGPSIGGDWDVEKSSFGILSAVGVHRFHVSDEQLLKFDERYDDGNFDSGLYRKLASDRFYYIVSE
jgi:prepilin-type N-terminal cleavage/methylation domain-containing protein